MFLALCGICRDAPGQEIHLKTRSLPDDTQLRTPSPSRRANGPVHQIVQFDHVPGVEDLDALLATGARVVAMVPDNAVMVVIPRRVNRLTDGMRWRGDLESADKISPALAPAGVSPGTVELAIVEFHADVTGDVQDLIAGAAGLTFLRTPLLLPNHVIVTADGEALQALAERDEVAYIFPADPALLTSGFSMACVGLLTLSGPVAQYSNIVHGWNPDADHVTRLGYVFGDLTPKLPAAMVQTEILRALNEWSKNANVVFHAESSQAAARTLLVRFATGPHGDAYPFDGPGGTLAHTFYPVPVNPESIAGDMHLDADENWHAGGDVDVYSVALHEAGHAIGLGHSDKPGDVMYPYYRHGMQLSANDIGAAQKMYGAATANPATPGTITTGPPVQTPLSLSLNPVPPPGQATQVSVTGLVAGGTPPLAVQWQTDHGYSGRALTGTGGTWTATGITLVTGANTLTVSALDSAHLTASQSVSVVRLQTTPVSGGAPVSVSISTPSSSVVSTGNPTISLAGVASGGAGVSQVIWQTNGGASGTATGVEHWIIPDIPLLAGTNTIVVRAVDARGASAWAAMVAARR